MISGGCDDSMRVSVEGKQNEHEEIKANNINRVELINMLWNEENPYANAQDRELYSKQINDLKS